MNLPAPQRLQLDACVLVCVWRESARERARESERERERERNRARGRERELYGALVWGGRSGKEGGEGGGGASRSGGCMVEMREHINESDMCKGYATITKKKIL